MDKQFFNGRIRFSKNRHPACGISLISAGRESEAMAMVNLGRYSLRCWIGRWFKSKEVFRDLSQYHGKPGFEGLRRNAAGAYGFTDLITREYSIAVTDDAVVVRFGPQDFEDENKNACKVFFIPWRQYHRETVHLLDTEGRHWRTYNARVKRTFEECRALGEDQPTSRYLIRHPEDGMVILKARMEESHYTCGDGKWAWLRWFFPARVYRYVDISLDLNFNDIQAWRGAYVSESVECDRQTSLHTVVRRYCVERKLVYQLITNPTQSTANASQ